MQLKDLFVALAIPALCTAAAIPQDTQFPDGEDIVGGEAASAGQFPFIVSIQRNGRHFCGGSLLNANTVLTAAHCAVGQAVAGLSVRAGSLNRASGGTVSAASAVRVNSGYVASTYDGDVAIIKLATPIPTSSTITYATLAAAGSDPASGTLTSVAGWGTLSSGGSTSPTLLQKVDVPVVSRATCQSNYPTRTITTNMWCAGLAQGGKDSCQGDSGGPIVVASTRVLAGIVSWGEGCAAAGKPGVYTRVGATAIRNFINANI
ncbi:trypsin-domain-containing protein [Cucurbitaria berberidis CBS 394.84]|uniref:Trypsin-domain-containing protein n=1 Tax=Cucurbitaria berberidis CBS 394.84 TaxID=1168544 RepID=A0A9P4GVT1_9PLEO|nr:trypsin-domain-containing protein [Cucurbitaria berberidis CBS 394.84]KAF1852222.1 trypsin-domain-containing protein [Cucurbitaria berberidis CBS 394.84]